MTKRVAKGQEAKDGPASTEDARGETITAIVGTVHKVFGEDSASILSDSELFSHVKDYISTQSYALDFALHRPGLPVGRSVTIVGAEASGKSTLAVHVLAETQARGGIGVLLDTEAAFDEERAERMGINPETLIVMQPETVEQATGEIEKTIDAVISSRIKTGVETLVTIVWDSVAGTPTKAELEGEPGDVLVGPHAKALSSTLRRLTRKVAKECILLIFINQEKDRVNMSGWGGKGGKTMVAERPLGFHSSVILNCHRTEILRRSDKTPYAIRSRIKVQKNKKAAPFSEAEIVINFDDGIDRLASILAVALALGIVTKEKGWCKYGERRFRESQLAEIMGDEPGIMEALEEARNRLVVSAQPEGAGDDDFEDDDAD